MKAAQQGQYLFDTAVRVVIWYVSFNRGLPSFVGSRPRLLYFGRLGLCMLFLLPLKLFNYNFLPQELWLFSNPNIEQHLYPCKLFAHLGFKSVVGIYIFGVIPRSKP